MSDQTATTPDTPDATRAGVAESSVRGVPIVLDRLTKKYPGSDDPAVDAVTVEIPAGEIVMLVGPSGCGKTTTMRMINRLITPTSGTITIDGKDAQSLKEVTLRRQIGYVIQQIGLFPHLTIASNVALVPRMLKWDKDRIATRVDEMLNVVGLEPETFAHRYPRQLSGGQQQRVGVARALAADPPIMLMDEPFGAVDPITRARLQDEFLSLQRALGKTVVFVTHDFDEALKMGDRIAILQKGSKIAQYDTPERILSNPANEFVDDFIGQGATLKRLKLEHLDRLELRPVSRAVSGAPQVPRESTLHGVLDMMMGSGADSVAITEDGKVVGALELADVLKRVSELREERERGTPGDPA